MSLEEHCGTANAPAEFILIGTAGGVQNEAGTVKVIKANKSTDPLAFYQQQIILKYQIKILATTDSQFVIW